MNIGIMSFHAALNSGAVLQAYALQTQLERMGHSVEFINYRRIRKRKLNHFLAKSIKKTWWKWQDYIQDYLYAKNDAFGYVLKRGTTIYRSIDELQKNPPEYDVYLAGSDQIWNVGSNRILSKQYYLSFGDPSIKRIAFAASFGQCEVLPFLENDIRTEVMKFDAVSVREKNGVEYLQQLMGKDKKIHHICDPTFLLSANDYLQIATEKKEEKPYIASYILHAYFQEQLNIVEHIKKHTHSPILNLRNPDTCIRLPKAENKIVTPYQWLGYIKNAELVICCSFHAVVFSLLFHKPFVVVSPVQNARISSLLEPLGLMNRFFVNFEPSKIEEVLNTNIDWQKVDAHIEKEKNKAIEFLETNLN